MTKVKFSAREHIAARDIKSIVTWMEHRDFALPRDERDPCNFNGLSKYLGKERLIVLQGVSE